MFYKITKRKNPLNQKEEKFYAEPSWTHEIGVRGLCALISNACSVNSSDVRAVIEALLFQLPRELMNGTKIRLDDFGIFKLSFRSEGQLEEKSVDASKIMNPHLIFTPGKELKAILAQTAYTKR